jgi:uncharacterized protein YrrD
MNTEGIAARELSVAEQLQTLEAVPANTGEPEDPKTAYLTRASELVLIGLPVKTTEGEDVGKVEDLILDAKTGNVEYVVVATPGLAGSQEKLVAVPAVAFAFPGNRRTLVVAVSKKKIEAAPSFRKDQWPQMADGQWRTSVDEYYLAQLPGSDEPSAEGSQPTAF